MSRMTLSTRNGAAVRAGLRQYGVGAVARAQAVMQASGIRMHTIALSLCPYDRLELDDFHMIEHLRLEFSPAMLSYQVGFREQDFRAAGQPFYPIYTEFGTRKMAAQPCIFPARDHELPRFRRELAQALKVPRGRA